MSEVIDWEPEDIPPQPNQKPMQKWVRALTLYSLAKHQRQTNAAKHYLGLYWKYLLGRKQATAAICVGG